MVRPEHKSSNISILSDIILNVSKGIAGRSNNQNISGTYTIFTGFWHFFEFRIYVIRACFEFRISTFGFIEK